MTGDSKSLAKDGALAGESEDTRDLIRRAAQRVLPGLGEDEVRRRLGRRKGVTFSRTPRAWCLGVRTCDTRITPNDAGRGHRPGRQSARIGRWIRGRSCSRCFGCHRQRERGGSSIALAVWPAWKPAHEQAGLGAGAHPAHP